MRQRLLPRAARRAKLWKHHVIHLLLHLLGLLCRGTHVLIVLHASNRVWDWKPVSPEAKQENPSKRRKRTQVRQISNLLYYLVGTHTNTLSSSPNALKRMYINNNTYIYVCVCTQAPRPFFYAVTPARTPDWNKHTRVTSTVFLHSRSHFSRFCRVYAALI